VTGPGGVLATVSRALSRLGGFVLLASAFLIGGEILSRKLLGASLNMATELSSYALAIAAALAFGDTLLHRAHIRVDAAYRLFPPFGRSLLDVASAASLAALGILLAWRGAEVALESLRLGARENTSLGTPLVWPQGIWAAALGWFALVATVVALRAARALARRDLDTVAQLAGPAGIEEEVESEMADARARLGATQETG
jgi:TRAP-type C4-dicarboxylate transport system permease small subunit